MIIGGATAPDYGDKDKAFYVDHFVDLVVKNASYYENFTVHDIKDKLGLNKNETLIFNDISMTIRSEILNRGYAEAHQQYARQLILYRGAKDKLVNDINPKKEDDKKAEKTLNFYGDNYGLINHDLSFGDDAHIKNESNKDPNKNINPKSYKKTAFAVGLVVLSVIATSILNADKIKNFINSIF